MCPTSFNLLQQKRQDVNLRIDQNQQNSQKNFTDVEDNNGQVKTNEGEILTTQGQINTANTQMSAISNEQSGVQKELAGLKNQLENPDLDDVERNSIEKQIKTQEMLLANLEQQQIQQEQQQAALEQQQAALEQQQTQLQQAATELEQTGVQLGQTSVQLEDELAQVEADMVEFEQQQATPVEEKPQTKTTVQFGDTVSSFVDKQLAAMKADNPNATKEDALALLIKNNPDVINSNNLDKIKLNADIVFEGEVDVSNVKSVAENEAMYSANKAKKSSTTNADTPVEEKKPKTEAEVLTEAISRQETDLNKAQAMFDNREKEDGWAGDVANSVAGFFGSENTSDNIKGDLTVARYQITGVQSELEGAGLSEAAQTPENMTEAAKAEFAKTYGVEFNAGNMQACMDKRDELDSAISTVAMNDVVQNKLGPVVSAYQTHNGNFDAYAQLLAAGNEQRIMPVSDLDREVAMMQLELTMTDVVGDKTTLNEIASSLGVDLSKSSNDEKFALYSKLSKGLMTATQSQVDSLVGESLPQDYIENLRNEYSDAHTKAYGEKGDILTKVEDYVSSQEIGSSVVKDITKAATAVAATAAIVASGGTAAVALGAGTAVTSAAVDISDLATNDIDGDVSENLGNITKNAVIDSAMAIVGGSVGKSIKGVTSALVSPTTKAGKIGLQFTNDLAVTTFKDGATTLLKGDLDFSNISSDTGVNILVGSAMKSVLKFSRMPSGKIGTDILSESMTKGATQTSTEDYKALVIKELEKNNDNADTISWLKNNPEVFEQYIKENM